MASDLTYKDIINPTYPHKLVDLIDETEFRGQAHKVRLLNDKLDPIAWDLLRDLLIALKVAK
jgi:hypothetical protein